MFRKVAAVAVGATLMVAPVADARPSAGPQEESGQVLGATPHPQDPSICFQGIARRMNIFAQGNYNGPVFGSIFDVDEATWGGKFKLAITDSAMGSEDIDLYFYKDFGPWIPDDPIANSPTILGTFQERNTEGEAGVVPAESVKALVCLYSGAEASWEYEATPAKVKKAKKKG